MIEYGINLDFSKITKGSMFDMGNFLIIILNSIKSRLELSE